MTPQFYDLSIFPLSKKIIYNLAWFFLGVKNNLKEANNLVLYDAENEKYIRQNRMSNFNAFDIPLCYDVPKNYLPILMNNLNNKKRIIYFGRIDGPQKNIDNLNAINKKLNLIDFYGVGNKDLINELGDSYKGYILPDADLEKLFSQYKFLILMSNYEGFSYSTVQALSYGVPIIVRDSFISASFLIANGKNG
ncbi:glycosyltransferase, partial [bacterium]|nr:glycosyltransferase [bacterium]